VLRQPRDPALAQQLAGAHAKVAGVETEARARRLAYQAALAEFRRARRLVPGDAFAQLNIARMLTELAALVPPGATVEEVTEAFDEALALAPGQFLFGRDATWAALVLGEIDRAEAYARRNLERLPDYGPSRAQLGQVAMARSDWERAERELMVAVEQRWFDDEPLRIEAWAALAHVRLELGRLRKALSAAEAALAIDPHYAEARLLERIARARLAGRAAGDVPGGASRSAGGGGPNR
jgi:tetratricopeptide (TPR) repeat protein